MSTACILSVSIMVLLLTAVCYTGGQVAGGMKFSISERGINHVVNTMVDNHLHQFIGNRAAQPFTGNFANFAFAVSNVTIMALDGVASSEHILSGDVLAFDVAFDVLKIKFSLSLTMNPGGNSFHDDSTVVELRKGSLSLQINFASSASGNVGAGQAISVSKCDASIGTFVPSGQLAGMLQTVFTIGGDELVHNIVEERICPFFEYEVVHDLNNIFLNTSSFRSHVSGVPVKMGFFPESFGTEGKNIQITSKIAVSRQDQPITAPLSRTNFPTSSSDGSMAQVMFNSQVMNDIAQVFDEDSILVQDIASQPLAQQLFPESRLEFRMADTHLVFHIDSTTVQFALSGRIHAFLSSSEPIFEAVLTGTVPVRIGYNDHALEAAVMASGLHMKIQIEEGTTKARWDDIGTYKQCQLLQMYFDLIQEAVEVYNVTLVLTDTNNQLFGLDNLQITLQEELVVASADLRVGKPITKTSQVTWIGDQQKGLTGLFLHSSEIFECKQMVGGASKPLSLWTALAAIVLTILFV